MGMTLGEIYQLAIEMGMKADPRDPAEVERTLAEARRRYETATGYEKEIFDQEELRNPYADTRILVGEPERRIEGVLTGIDMEVGEVLLADRLRHQIPIDLILTHHPEGMALAGLYEVMHLQEDVLEKFGVPIHIAEGIMDERIKEVQRSLLPTNHERALDAARLLNLAVMSCHTPADNMVTSYLQNLFDTQRPETVGDVLDLLYNIPEYAQAARKKAALKITVGEKKRRTGKIFVDMTGGTGGSPEAFANLARAGVGTVVCMHISEKNREKAKENHMNVIIAGHMASDSLGMNLFLDALEKRGVQITTCSGLIRVRR